MKKKPNKNQHHHHVYRITGLPNTRRSSILHSISEFCQLSTNQTIYSVFWWIIPRLYLQICAHPSWSVSVLLWCFFFLYFYVLFCFNFVVNVCSYIKMHRRFFKLHLNKIYDVIITGQHVSRVWTTVLFFRMKKMLVLIWLIICFI